MKIGLVSAILADYGFEKMVDTVSELGFDCVEVACWPCGKAERRYAGVSHIDVDELDEARRDYILDYCAQRKVEISSLAFYPNTLDGDPLKRAANVEHLKKVIRASAMLGVNMVTTFIGRVTDKSLEENLELLPAVWDPILERAGLAVAMGNARERVRQAAGAVVADNDHDGCAEAIRRFLPGDERA